MTAIRLSTAAAIITSAALCHAQQVTQPVYRPADGATAQTAATPVAAAAAPLNLVAAPGEHPLGPCKRAAEEALVRIDNEIRDYTCVFTKMERMDGTLSEPQQMQMRVAHQPFSIYMKFVRPYAGREALYVDGQNNNKLVALSEGWKRNLGKVYLDPNGSMAMDGQRHPITKAGIRNLTAEMIRIMEGDMKYAECEVRNYPEVKIDDRATTMIESIHPQQRNVFKYHVARIYIDNEYRIPTAFELYTWPTQAGGKPELMEKYIYTNLQINTGLTAQDFSVDNPQIFR